MNDISSRRAAPASEAALPTGADLTVDLGALAANWRLLRDRAGSAECAAVIKADAYGLGIEPTATALGQAGCRTFFVAHLSEAVRVRRTMPQAAVYVLNGLLPGTADTYAAFDLRPVLGSREEIAEWAAFCRTQGRRPAAIHVDTGMNRLGLGVTEAVALTADPMMADVEPSLVMSHLVASEEPNNPVNARQIEAFAAVRAAYPGVNASLANSSGIFLAQAPHYDLVRPGYALYGGNPMPDRANPMRAVIRLEARVIQLREVEAGESCGYNATWTAASPRRLATISVGYADGYPRAASGTDSKAADGIPAGEAIVAGIRCPFAGRVSMDLIVIDVSAVPEGRVRRGDPVVLIGDGLDVDEVGRRAGSIGYDILTGLGRRYARRYRPAST